MTELDHTGLPALPRRRDLLERIDRLAVSADAKALLARLHAVTVEVGGRIVEVGRRILAFAFEMLKTFPNVTFGVIVALVMSMLIASIPLLGGLLAPLLTPLLLAIGLGAGALADLKEGAMARRVQHLEAQFQTLTA